MITSNQVSGLMAQQAQQQQMLGMGSPSVALGQSQYPPQYNFGNMGMLNNSLSGTGGLMGATAAGISGLGTAATTAAGVSGLAAGFGIGGATMGGLAGSFLGLNPLTMGLMAGGAGLSVIGGTAAQGLQTNAQVGRFLSSANFANPASTTGFGFGFSDQYRMTDSIIGMGASNPFVNQQDQMQLLNQFQQMGLDKGVTSMGKMIEKFKEFSKTTEDVAQQLGKTVSEVTGYVTQLRGQGFYSAEEVTGMSRRFSSMANYGMDAGQAAQMASNMASITRAQGMSGRAGSLLSTNAMSGIAASLQAGFMDERQAMDITGTTNVTDASAGLANMIGGKLSAALTGGGTLEKLLAGFTTTDESGRMVIDEGMVSNAARGGADIQQLLSRASSNISGGGQAKFRGGKKRLASEFLQTEQGMDAALGTIMSMSQELASSRDNLSLEDAFNIISQEHLGLMENEAEALFDYTNNLKATRRKVLTDRANMLAAEERRSDIAMNKSFKGSFRKISHEFGLLTRNPFLQKTFAQAGIQTDAALANLENAYYGTEVSTAGLFTDEAVGKVRSDFLSGNLDELSDIQRRPVSAQDIYKSRMAGYTRMTDSMEGINKFQSALTSGMSESEIATLRGIELDSKRMREFQHFTEYGERDQEFFTTDAMDNQMYNYAAADIKRKIAKATGKDVSQVTDREVHVAMSQTKEGSRALQKYAGRNNLFGGKGLENTKKDAFLGMATRGNLEGAMTRTGGLLLGAGAGAVSGAATGAAIGAGIGAIFGGVGALPGAKIGAAIGFGVGIVGGAFTGFMAAADNEHARLLESGVGTKLLAKLNGTAKLKEFDKIYREAKLTSDSEEEAITKTAKRLTDKYGEEITPEDVRTALKSMQQHTGKDYLERIKSGDYKKALELAKGAKGYQDEEILTKHLDTMADGLSGAELEGADDLRAALLGGDVEGARAQMLDIARKAGTGEITYEGDNEIAKMLTSSGETFDQMKHLVGKDISALDAMLGGKGQGANYRKMAGVRSGSAAKITTKELRRISDLVATNKAFQAVEAAAEQDLVTTAGEGATKDVIKATTSLLNSTNKLAVYVDNIASVVTGNEVAGQQLAITKKDS